MYARKTKHYPVAPTTARPDPYLPERVLPVTLDEGTNAVVNVPVSDDFDSAIEDDELESVTLGVRVVQPHPNDTITYRINGHELSTDDAKITHFYGGLVPYMPVKVGMPQRINTHYWFEFDVPHEVIRRGDNVVEVTMERRWEWLLRRPGPAVGRGVGTVQGPADPGSRSDVGNAGSLPVMFL